MLRHETRRTFDLQHEPDGHISRDTGRRDRIESVAGGAREQFAMPCEPWRPRRNRFEQRLRQCQLRWLQRRHQRHQRRALIFARGPARGDPIVAAHPVDVVLPAENRRRTLGGPAVIHVDRHQRLFDRRHRPTRPNGALADPIECGAPNLHQAVEFVGLIQPIRPPVGARIGLHILIRQIADVLRPCIVQDLCESGGFVGLRGELPVAVVDGDLVPLADALRIGVRQIDRPVRPQLLERMRVVHHRDPALVAVVVVVAEAERVTGFVGRQLANSLERGVVEHGRPLCADGVRRQQPFEDHVVLTIAQRPERDRGLDDFAGARIGDGAAGTPAARRTVDPVDHVVADVHRVGVGRQHVHLEGVTEPGGLECLIPPAGALEQRLPHVFRRAAVHPVLNRDDRLADGGRRVFLLEPMPADPVLGDVVADRRAVIHERDAAVTGARIFESWCIAGSRQLHQRQVLAQGHCLWRRRDAADRSREQATAAPTGVRNRGGADRVGTIGRPTASAAAATPLAGEGERHLDLAVLRKRSGPRHVHRATAAVDAVGARPERITSPMVVAEQKLGGINQDAPVGFRRDREAPQH